ncbi:hypothetical protein V7S43_017907 [Phytophthora oleae]|uniref:Elicitin n=1 Tax=Phytophthora oleae TaxID=2107226 RepID=A0ABD3EU98_9STRA
MKISALSLLVTIGLSSSTLVFAAECTADDLTTISTTYSDAAMSEGAAKCPELTTSADTKNYCDASDCLDYMTGLLDLLPDCTSGGINVRAGLRAAIDFCETGTVDDTSDIAKGSASSSSLLRSGSPSTASSSTTSSSTGSMSITSSSTGSTTSDKTNENTAASSAGGSSSSASSVSVAISTVALAVAAFVFTGAL